MPVNPDGLAVPLRLDRLLGDRGRRRGAAAARRPLAPRPAARRSTRCSPRPKPASPAALAALDDTGRWLGIGLAGLVNVLNPSLVVLGGLFGRIHPFVRADRSRPSSIGALSRAPRRLVRVVPDRARRRRPAARRSGARVRAVPRRSGGLAASPRGPCPRWRAPDGTTGRRIARRPRSQRRSLALTIVAYAGDTALEESQRMIEATNGRAARCSAAVVVAVLHQQRRRCSASAPSAAASAGSERRRQRRLGRGATDCTVGVSWNNFQQPRWAAHDEPNIKKTVEAGGGKYIDADANLSNEQQLTDVDTLISQGAKVLILLAQDNEGDPAGAPEGQGRGHPGHRL